MPEQTPTAILVHGFLDSGEIWRPVMNILGIPAAGWITPDLPGMGELTNTERPFILHGYSDVVTASIDRVGGAVVLVGHSMGAQIVELAALRRPQSVLGLLLLSPVPLAGAHAPDPVVGRSPQPAERSTLSARRAAV
jgi:pimeloyl-ACP methyl ester carboxylesterase